MERTKLASRRHQNQKIEDGSWDIPVTDILKRVCDPKEDDERHWHSRIKEYETDFRKKNENELKELREKRKMSLEGRNTKHEGEVAHEILTNVILGNKDHFLKKNRKIDFSQKTQNFQVEAEKLIRDYINQEEKKGLSFELFKGEIRYQFGSMKVCGTPDCIVKQAGEEGGSPVKFKTSDCYLEKSLAQLIAYCMLMGVKKGFLIILGIGAFLVQVEEKQGEAILEMMKEMAQKINREKERKMTGEYGMKCLSFSTENSLLRGIQEQILLLEERGLEIRYYSNQGHYDEQWHLSYSMDPNENVPEYKGVKGRFYEDNMQYKVKPISGIGMAFRVGKDIGLAIGSDRELRESRILHFLYMAYKLGLRFIFVCKTDDHAQQLHKAFIAFVKKRTDPEWNHWNYIGVITASMNRFEDDGSTSYFADQGVIHEKLSKSNRDFFFHYVFTDFEDGNSEKDWHLWDKTKLLLRDYRHYRHYKYRFGYFFSFADTLDVLYREDMFPRGYRNNN